MEKKYLFDTLKIALENLQSNIHTTTIAKVTKVGDKTISCKPVINKIINDKVVEFPEFTEVPIIFLQGAETYTMYPVKENDYCLLFFTERCFDKWWGGQDYQEPLDKRMHDYSDAFALIGVVPRDKSLPIPKDKIITKGNLQREGNIENKGNIKSEGDLTVIGNCSLGKEGASKIPIVKEDMDTFITNLKTALTAWIKTATAQGWVPPTAPLDINPINPITTKVKVE